MWTYKYLCIAPSLGLLQRSNLQRVCVSAVMTPARCCPISQECPAVLVTLLLQTVISSLPAAVEKGKLSEVGLTLEGLGAPVGSPRICASRVRTHQGDGSSVITQCDAPRLFVVSACVLEHSNLAGG